jgi:rhodanese-related sulfurtransferase
MNILKFFKAQFRSIPRFTPAECAARVRSGEAVLIDVREPKEWTAGVAELAVLLPLSDLTGRRKRWKPFLAAHDGRELLLYCGAGVRSAMAAKTLAAEGFKTGNAGGYPEWVSAGWPVVRPAVSAGTKTH